MSGLLPVHPLRQLILRQFHNSRVSLSSRWTAAEDTLLLKRYEEFGPAWTVLALGIRSRSPTECRRRWLTVTLTVKELDPEERRLVYEEGYEKHGDQLVKVPQERILPGPFAMLAATIKKVRFRSQRKLGGWTNEEIMTVQEGYEQNGPRWDLIAKRMQFRTGRQCRNMMQKRFIEWGQHLVEGASTKEHQKVDETWATDLNKKQ